MSAAAASPERVRARFSRDFYFELMRGSQERTASFFIERERWLRSVNVEGREELLFELEMLLRGVERYFNLHNLPIDTHRPVVTRDFHEELVDVRDAIDQAIRLARALLDPDADQKMVFRKYVETQLADDRARRLLVEDALDQDSPQESLFVLRQGFDALRTIIDHLVKLPLCSFPLYSDVGNLVLRDVVLNRYFRPFRPLEFRIEYDRIKSVRVLEALAVLPDLERRLFTVAFLSLFRALHYLSYAGAEKPPLPRRSRVILALSKSELVTLVGFLKAELATKVPRKRHQGVALKVARDLSRESARIAHRLSEKPKENDEALLEAAVELTELLRRQLSHLAGAIDAGLAEVAFTHLVSHVQMSQRLRQDLWVFAKLCGQAEAALRDEGTAEAALSALHQYLGYFYDVSYQLLRYGDYEAFDRFAALLAELPYPPAGPVARARLAEDCRIFAQVAETTFAAVNRRAELAGRKLNIAEAEALRARFSPPLLPKARMD
ncbi:MAG: hypothetical protein ACOZIN_04025 [Myxococcota bacterium]